MEYLTRVEKNRKWIIYKKYKKSWIIYRELKKWKMDEIQNIQKKMDQMSFKFKCIKAQSKKK